MLAILSDVRRQSALLRKPSFVLAIALVASTPARSQGRFVIERLSQRTVRGPFIRALAFTLDGYHLVVSDGSTLVLDLRRQKARRIETPGYVVAGTEPYEIHVAFAGGVSVWDIRDGKCTSRYRLDPTDNVQVAAISPDGHWFVYRNTKRQLRLLDRKSGSLLSLAYGSFDRIELHPNRPLCTFSAGRAGPGLILKAVPRVGVRPSSCDGGGIRGFDPDAKTRRLPGARCVGFAVGGKAIVVLSGSEADGSIELRTLDASGTVARARVFARLWANLSPSLGLSHGGKKLTLWRLPRLERLADYEVGPARLVAASPSGRFVAIAHGRQLTTFRVRPVR